MKIEDQSWNFWKHKSAEKCLKVKWKKKVSKSWKFDLKLEKVKNQNDQSSSSMIKFKSTDKAIKAKKWSINQLRSFDNKKCDSDFFHSQIRQLTLRQRMSKTAKWKKSWNIRERFHSSSAMSFAKDSTSTEWKPFWCFIWRGSYSMTMTLQLSCTTLSTLWFTFSVFSVQSSPTVGGENSRQFFGFQSSMLPDQLWSLSVLLNRGTCQRGRWKLFKIVLFFLILLFQNFHNPRTVLDCPRFRWNKTLCGSIWRRTIQIASTSRTTRRFLLSLLLFRQRWFLDIDFSYSDFTWS